MSNGWISCTVTLHLADRLEPSVVVAVIVVVPIALAMILPLEDTVATLVLLEEHSTVLLEASIGKTVAS